MTQGTKAMSKDKKYNQSSSSDDEEIYSRSHDALISSPKRKSFEKRGNRKRDSGLFQRIFSPLNDNDTLESQISYSRTYKGLYWIRNKRRKIRKNVVFGFAIILICILTFASTFSLHSNFKFSSIVFFSSKSCYGRRIPKDTIIVMKTGSNVLHRRLTTQLDVTLRCIPKNQLILVSDWETTFKGHKVHDAFLNSSKEILEGEKVYDYHEALKQVELRQLNAINSSSNELKINQDKIIDDIANEYSSELVKTPFHNDDKIGWILDKLKFVPMLVTAWKYRLYQTKWFIFIEADTFIDPVNTANYLSIYDNDLPHFIGFRLGYTENKGFAHGGSGFALNDVALETTFKFAIFEEIRTDLNETFVLESFNQFNKITIDDAADIWQRKNENSASGSCCGDIALASTLEKIGNITVEDAAPFFSSSSIMNAEMFPRQWCSPVLTLHHISSEWLKKIDKIQRKSLSFKKRLMWQDLYYEFVEQNVIAEEVQDWDSDSNDKVIQKPYISWWEAERQAEIAAAEALLPPISSNNQTEDAIEQEELRLALARDDGWKSKLHCKDACLATFECLQWSYVLDDCRLGFAVKRGWPKPSRLVEGEATNVTSGWLKERIQSRISSHKCDLIKW